MVFSENNLVIKKLTMSILALDPAGTSQTGYFYFANWSHYEIGSINGKNYLIQAKNLENLLKKLSPQVLVWETSYWWKTTKAQKDLQELVYLNGVLGWLAEEYSCESKQILNHSVKEVLSKQKIVGLEQAAENGWQFKEQVINQHERDALLVFWIYWVRVLRKEWPFA